MNEEVVNKNLPFYQEKFIELLKEAEMKLGTPLHVVVGSRTVETGEANSTSSYLWGREQKREYACRIYTETPFYIG